MHLFFFLNFYLFICAANELLSYAVKGVTAIALLLPLLLLLLLHSYMYVCMYGM